MDFDLPMFLIHNFLVVGVVASVVVIFTLLLLLLLLLLWLPDTNSAN